MRERIAFGTRRSLLDLRDGLVRLRQMHSSLKSETTALLDQTDVLLNILEHTTLEFQGIQKRCQVQLSYARIVRAKCPTLFR